MPGYDPAAHQLPYLYREDRRPLQGTGMRSFHGSLSMRLLRVLRIISIVISCKQGAWKAGPCWSNRNAGFFTIAKISQVCLYLFMPGKNLSAAQALRARIPVGLSEAIRLMETSGDIEQAFLLLREKYLHIVMAKTRLAEDIALPCLVRYHYDTARAIDHLNEAFRLVEGIPQTETVYLLERWQNHRAQGIQKIAAIAEKAAGLERDDDYWLSAAELNKPGTVYKCVIVLCEWLEYKDAEDLNHALHFHPELVIGQVQLLGLDNLAASIAFASSIQKETRLKAEKAQPEPIPRYNLTMELLYADEDYQAAKQYILAQNDVLVDTLYLYIRDHSDQFP